MTIDEKLQHFYEVSLDEAREDAAQAIQEHKEHLARTLEDHKQTSRQNAEAEIKAETGHVRREVNKALSAEQITLRRDLSRKQEELKETLFTEVKTKVQQFITTAEYDEYLCRRINEAVKFAGDDEIQIYLSSSDKAKATDLIFGGEQYEEKEVMDCDPRGFCSACIIRCLFEPGCNFSARQSHSLSCSGCPDF